MPYIFFENVQGEDEGVQHGQSATVKSDKVTPHKCHIKPAPCVTKKSVTICLRGHTIYDNPWYLYMTQHMTSSQMFLAKMDLSRPYNYRHIMVPYMTKMALVLMYFVIKG